MTTHVIVGGGLAAAHAAAAMRAAGFTGRVVLIGAEPHPPYERPPMSKGYLAGTATFEGAFVHPAAWYDTHDIELMLGVPVTALDLDAHRVTVDNQPISYDRLLLATGSTARRLAAADHGVAAVAYLRTVEDADWIKGALRSGRRVAIVGGGWIGLEVAAAARTAGCDVVVIEPLAEPLIRVLGPTIGGVFASLHRSHGVELRTNTNVTEIRNRPGVGSVADGIPGVVQLHDGTSVEADLIVVGIGATPNTDLAEAAGLKIEDGVLTDEHLRTSHPDVFAAGDVANALHPNVGRHLRVEHWDNAIAQGGTAARNMLGAEEVYDRMPYFFSDQYDLGMEYIGHVGQGGHDELVLRGDPTSGAFTAFWVKDDRVVAAMHANDWDATTPMRAIVAAGTVELPALRDPRVPLDHLAH